jgi:hypothetical protein
VNDLDPFRREYRPLTAEEKRQLEELKLQAEHFYGFVKALGAKREYSLALTKIEEAVMWATKGLTQ